jgi:hypothetical protein
MGRGNCNLRYVTHMTGAVVSFPEPTVSFYNIPTPAASSMPNRKSNVKIRGRNFESAYKGWLELQNFLPLLLIFDLPDGKDCDPILVTRLMEELGVSINIKPKQKQNSKSVMVRGPERQSRSLFEVRRQILDLDDSEVPARDADPPLWPQDFRPTPFAAIDQPVSSSSQRASLSRATSTGSSLDSHSRARGPPETSLSTIMQQQREQGSVHRRLDTIDSTSTDHGSSCDYQSYRSFFESNKSTLSDSFQPDEVFASSLSQPDTFNMRLANMTDEETGSGDMMQPTSEFGSILSQTFPKDIWRQAIAKRDNRPSASRFESGRGANQECAIS